MGATEPEQPAPNGQREPATRGLFFKAVVLPFVFIMLVAVWLAWQVLTVSDDSRWLDTTDLTIAQVQELSALILGRESRQRAFLLTHDRAFLDAHRPAEVDGAFALLAALVSDDDEETENVRTLRARYDQWRATAEAEIAAPVPPTDPDLMRVHEEQVRGMRATIDAILTHEHHDRSARSLRSQRETSLAVFGVAGTLTLLAIALTLLSYRQIHLIQDLVTRERRAKREAERALRARDEFLSTLSHELRTPLTSVLGWAAILRRRTLDREVEHGIEVIERNAKAEVQLVDDLLDVSRIVSHKLVLQPASLDLNAVVRDAVEVVAIAAKAKGVAVETCFEAPELPMNGDARRLQQVLWNLLSNAVKFTPKGGRITVHTGRAEAGACVQVTDTGEGIAPDFLPHVFEQFRQADASKTRTHGGLGLGLAIVKHLVELHGGTIEAASEGRGYGATFTLTLPCCAASGCAVAAAIPSPGIASLQGVRVLVVDDDPSSREVISVILAGYGAKVECAASAVEALDCLSRTLVDVLVSDIGMPGVDGYELLRRLRCSPVPERRRIPSVALTAYAAPEDARRAQEAGFEVHLAKPIAPGRLADVIARLTRRPM